MKHWRWLVVAVGVTMLCAVPVVSAQWPVDQPTIDVATLEARIASSAATPFEGLFRSRGGLRLPDLGRLADEVAPFRQTHRVRIWYVGPDSWRTDDLLVGGERGVYREPGTIRLWDSGRRRVIESPRDTTEPPRIPRLMDLAPSELGRRLLRDADGETITAIGARRIAGHVAAGLRITPATASTASTITSIDLWAEPTTGLVLGVEVRTTGAAPVLESAFEDLTLRSPSAAVVRFPVGEVAAELQQTDSVDPIETLASLPAGVIPFPNSVGGLARSDDGATAVATYGDGLTRVWVAFVPPGVLGRRIAALPRTQRPWGGEAALIETSLINVMLVRGQGYEVIVAGTVAVAELDRLAGSALGAGVSG